MHDPQNDPDFWVEEIRRVTTSDGDEMVVVADQDGEVYLIDVDDFTQRRFVRARLIRAEDAYNEVGHAYLTVRADEVRPGDLWLANEGEAIYVTGVEHLTDEAFAHHGSIDVARISGPIVRGGDRGPKVYSWTKLASEGMEVRR